MDETTPILNAEPPIVAATWQEREPTEPWGGDSLAAVLPWVTAHAAQHADARTLAAYGDWTLVGATRRGRSHAHRGQYREDSMALHAAEHVALFVAADGAGSAKWSRVGSELACRVTIASLAKALVEPSGDLRVALPNAVRTVCASLVDVSAAAQEAPRDFRTTLLVAALVNDGGAERLAVCQVGDGCVVVRKRDGTVTQIGTGDSGEYSGEVTCFVPDADAVQRAMSSIVILDASDVDCVLLCTDGIEDPFYPVSRNGVMLTSQLLNGVTMPAEHFQKQRAHGPVLGHPLMLERLDTWLQFERRGENDDRTLVAAFRASAVRAEP